MNGMWQIIVLTVATAIMAACAASDPGTTSPPGTVTMHMGGRMSVIGGAASAR